jgi:hypothetical protein
MSSLCDCEKFANLKKLCEYFAAESEIQRSRSEKLEAALRDFLLWGDHCQHCDYDDEWAKIEVRAHKALEENK